VARTTISAHMAYVMPILACSKHNAIALGNRNDLIFYHKFTTMGYHPYEFIDYHN
jgi:hypothetical protein